MRKRCPWPGHLKPKDGQTRRPHSMGSVTEPLAYPWQEITSITSDMGLVLLGYRFLSQFKGSIDDYHLGMASPTIRVTRERFRAVGTLHIVQGDRRHKREDTKGLLRGTWQLRLFALLFTPWLLVLLLCLLSCLLLLLRLCRSVS